MPGGASAVAPDCSGKLTLNGIGFVGIKTVLVGLERANYSVPSDNLMYIRLPDDIKSGAVTIVITNTLGATKTTVNVK